MIGFFKITLPFQRSFKSLIKLVLQVFNVTFMNTTLPVAGVATL